MFGEGGNDLLHGRDGSDFANPGAGADVVHTRAGSDQVEDYTGGRDRVFLGAGPDLMSILSDGQRDLVDCGAGNDTVVFYDSRDRVDQLTGCETVQVVASGRSQAQRGRA
jgi:Ca2+-binding RTX toxin-like protein